MRQIWCNMCTTDGNMRNEPTTNENHIAVRRLFDSTSPELQGEFHFDDWELVHLTGCEECQHIREVFARQLIVMKAKAGSNDAG
jgi:hypothetical protein